MKKMFLIEFALIIIACILPVTVLAQNLDNLLIEKMDNVSMVIPEECTPEDLIVVINSSIPELKFESNMLPDSEFIVTYYPLTNQYIICHKKIKFKLTVSGPNLQSDDIDIFDLDKTHGYTVSANIAKGQLTILSNPRNSIVIFDDFPNQPYSTNQPIKMVSGKYRVKIFKPQYLNVDTVVVIPRDAEKTYSIELIPQFARIKLNLATDDKLPFLKAPVIWIDSVRIDLDAYVKAGQNQRNFFDDVEFLKFYEGDIIPLKEGQYNITVEAESYNPYKTSVVAQNGKIVNITVSLEPIYGYVTFVDKQFAEGATVFIDDQMVGNIPLFKLKTRVGTHKVRLVKTGFIPLEEEYSVTVTEKQNTDFDVSMAVAKKIFFESDPTNAEVFMDGSRIGFTPFSIMINAGNHELVVRKNGYANEKLTRLINEQPPFEETVKLNLRAVNPLAIRSEEDGLKVKMFGTNELENIDIDTTLKTPTVMQLPYGKYKISLEKDYKTVYKSTVIHSPEITRNFKLPVFSRTSFHWLTANYENQDNFEASFGRVMIFPKSGLSTSILNLDYRVANITVDSTTYSIDYTFQTLAPYVFFLNWDWRLGGSILRQLDINLLGRAKYTPGLRTLNVNIPQLDDVTMQNYFYGFEISSRLSYFNISFRYGRQYNIGKVNYWDETNDEFYPGTFAFNESRNVATIGITFNGRVNKTNNMLRLWQKPLINHFKFKSKDKESTK